MSANLFQIQITPADHSDPILWQAGRKYTHRRQVGHYAQRLRNLHGHRAVKVIPCLEPAVSRKAP